MTHKKKDCFEGPKRVGAKFIGTDTALGEHVPPQPVLDDDGTRDQRNGCHLEEHMNIAEVDLAKQTLEALGHQELASGKLVIQSTSPKRQLEIRNQILRGEKITAVKTSMKINMQNDTDILDSTLTLR